VVVTSETDRDAHTAALPPGSAFFFLGILAGLSALLKTVDSLLSAPPPISSLIDLPGASIEILLWGGIAIGATGDLWIGLQYRRKMLSHLLRLGCIAVFTIPALILAEPGIRMRIAMNNNWQQWATMASNTTNLAEIDYILPRSRFRSFRGNESRIVLVPLVSSGPITHLGVIEFDGPKTWSAFAFYTGSSVEMDTVLKQIGPDAKLASFSPGCILVTYPR
jgi:hypothetical protein